MLNSDGINQSHFIPEAHSPEQIRCRVEGTKLLLQQWLPDVMYGGSNLQNHHYECSKDDAWTTSGM